MKSLFGIILILSGTYSYALDNGHPEKAGGSDSLLPVHINYTRHDEIASDILDAEADYDRTGDSHKALARLLKAIKVKRPAPEGRGGYRLFNNLARFSARLKLYPLAMKCYYKAEEYKRHTLLSWYQLPIIIYTDHSSPERKDDDLLLDSASYDGVINMDTGFVIPDLPANIVKSEPVQVIDLRESFHDGKMGISYALIVHVKQPAPGKRKPFTHINNVGHTFITLIKYNSDNSCVSRSFGFYPRKRNFFSATPLHVKAAPVFKDDAFHDWDEVVGKFISLERFNKVLGLLQEYEHMTYNLNRNNCTDFGLNAAMIGGIGIQETRGSWPLGRGNNPANAGQSILEGKFRDMDAECRGPLFVSNNISVLTHR